METNKLIDRLRELSKIGIVNYKHDTPVLIEAADRIEELDERIAIMQESMEALEKRCNALEERNEPIKPMLNESHSYVSDMFKCGKCGNTIRFHAKYCEDCGQRVSWND